MDTGLLNTNIVCLGGGIGTKNLLSGLKTITKNITVVASMADDGGSGGRLRRLYHMPPPGDIVSCMMALADKDSELAKLMLYRFPGDRYGEDGALAGQKMGNLLLAALYLKTKNFEKSIDQFQEFCGIQGTFLSATKEAITLSATTVHGKTIVGEQHIDLGKLTNGHAISSVAIAPGNPAVSVTVVEAIENASVIIAGPGDLYTTIIPVLMVPEITKALKASKAKKFFVVNVANKPYETKDYTVSDYIAAITKHIGFFPFSKIFVNSNKSHEIPEEFHYSYVSLEETNDSSIVEEDLVDASFPLYHDPIKLAKTIRKQI